LKTYKIAIFGCGFVGGTVANFLEQGGVDVVRVDPKLYLNTDPTKAIMDTDGIIICVPTPSMENGSCDDKHIKEVLELCDYRTKILLKSTVTPDLLSSYEPNVVYNPEFLREVTAKQDFENQHIQIFGHHDNVYDDAVWWSDLFNEIHTVAVPTEFTNRETASMIKYVHNAWLATKVAWFHELYDTMQPEVNYGTLSSVLGKFSTIGSTHMLVPNSLGTLGYSGSCFPKDLKALTNIVNHSIIKNVVKVNETLLIKEVTNGKTNK
jgi:UDPglucose 6-dehydrogenase